MLYSKGEDSTIDELLLEYQDNDEFPEGMICFGQGEDGFYFCDSNTEEIYSILGDDTYHFIKRCDSFATFLHKLKQKVVVGKNTDEKYTLDTNFSVLNLRKKQLYIEKFSTIGWYTFADRNDSARLLAFLLMMEAHIHTITQNLEAHSNTMEHCEKSTAKH